MKAPVQTTMPLRDPRYTRPTMTVDSAKGILDCTEDDIVELVEVQLALIAWNIAAPGAERRELRILTRSVSEYLRDNPDRNPCYHSTLCPAEAVSLVLPSDKPAFTGVEIQRSLNCGSTHVITLVESRALRLVPGTNYQRGPGGSPRIARESFIEFLKGRFAC